MKIPNKVKIGGINFTVEIKNDIDGGDTAGRLNTRKQLLTLTKGKQDFMNVTFFHEILHAINMELTETDIEFLSQSIYQVLKDNNLLK